MMDASRLPRVSSIKYEHTSSGLPGLEVEPLEPKEFISKVSISKVRFICDVCSKSYTTQRKLLNHMNSKHSPPESGSHADVMHQCDTCHKKFNNLSNLLRHTAKQLTTGTKVCLQCEFKAISKCALKSHQQEEHVGYACNKCERVFEKKFVFLKHIETQNGYGKQNCNQCDFKATSKCNWILHQRYQHKEIDPTNLKLKLKCTKCYKLFNRKHLFVKHEKVQIEFEKKDCVHCDFKASSMCNLTIHRKEEHPEVYPNYFKCKNCDYKSISRNGIKKHNRLLHKRLVNQICKYCEKVFSFKQLIRHTSTYEKNINKDCQNCDFKGTSSCILKLHEETEHQGVRYRCKKCDFKSSRKEMFASHMVNLHPSGKRACENCWKMFDPSRLLRHKKIQEQLVTKKCAKCNFKGTSQCNMKFHRKEKHGELTYICNICSFISSTKKNLRMHKQLSHDNGFECIPCEFKTTDRQNYRMHRDNNHGDNGYKCNICSKKFTTYWYFLQHKKSKREDEQICCLKCSFKTQSKCFMIAHDQDKHTGKDEAYACTECDFVSLRKRYVLRHKRETHNKENKPPKTILCQTYVNTKKCGYKAPNRDDLAIHKQLNHPKTIYECQNCDFSSKLLSKLTEHRESKHSEYECKQCEYRATREIDVMIHKETEHK